MILGIDIGGTNTVFGLVDANGNCNYKNSIKTTDFLKPEELVSAIYSLIVKLGLKDEFEAIGIGAPNGNFYNGTVEFAPNLTWEGIVPLAALFENKFKKKSYVTNDANAAAMGEKHFGIAKDVSEFVVITLGTGLGSGLVIKNEVVYGHSGFAGELGHTIIEPEGRKCNCGRKGCLETYVSATGIVRTAQLMITASELDSSLKNLEQITSLEIAKAAEKGDQLALEIFDFTAQKLGFALANYITTNDPELIVLFGGLANSGDLLTIPTKRYMERYLMPIFQNKVKIKISGIPQGDAAIIGAAATALNELNRCDASNTA